jgi:aminoglycoside phosphotransferase (APT) family kinase protein
VPFYVMERVRGIVLRGPQPPPGLDLPPERMRRVAEALIDGLAELHAVDVEAAGLAGFGRPEGYVERQVTGWSERWRRARIAGEDGVPDVDRTAAWLGEHLPLRTAGGGRLAALVHNDYKYDNLVLDPADPGRVLAVLDWEMATLGDPLMDLGTSLAYWVDPDDEPGLRALAFGPTLLPGNPRRVEVAERYVQASGREQGNLEDLLFFYVFGLFKTAVIAQQIYLRYAQGLTRDERFARLPAGIAALGRTAARAIERGRIDRLWS